MIMTRKTVYLANPLGFSSLQSRALNDIISALKHSLKSMNRLKAEEIMEKKLLPSSKTHRSRL